MLLIVVRQQTPSTGHGQGARLIPALGTVRNLGLLPRDQGKIGEGRAMFQRALVGRQEVLGPDHSDSLQVARDSEDF